jgi:DNA-binding Xre family transcriptional regulator
MLFRIYTLKAKATEAGRRLTWQQIADGTGIRKPTLFRLARSESRTIRPEYIDALCTFFGVTPGELMTADMVKLPLNLGIRPDRKGKLIRQRVKPQPNENASGVEEP